MNDLVGKRVRVTEYDEEATIVDVAARIDSEDAIFVQFDDGEELMFWMDDLKPVEPETDGVCPICEMNPAGPNGYPCEPCFYWPESAGVEL